VQFRDLPLRNLSDIQPLTTSEEQAIGTELPNVLRNPMGKERHGWCTEHAALNLVFLHTTLFVKLCPVFDSLQILNGFMHFFCLFFLFQKSTTCGLVKDADVYMEGL
jgi:hypothetical protein